MEQENISITNNINKDSTTNVEKSYYLKVDRKAFFYPENFLKIQELATPKQLYTILFLINTGARINEVRHVLPKDLDKERFNIKLWVTKKRAKLKEDRPTPRDIPVSTQFFKYLKKNINEYKILSTNQTGIILKDLSKQAGIENWKDMSAHNLRKTFGTWMLALNVNGFKLAQHLGHSPEMLRTHYASPDIFNYRDKDIMRDILGDLPNRLRGE